MIGYRLRGMAPLSGSVEISTSKNAALPIIAATILLEGQTVLKRLPALSDIHTMLDLIRYLGGKAEVKEDKVAVCTDNLLNVIPPVQKMRLLRASFLLMGPMLTRFNEATIPLPGGCKIGARPVDLHLHGFRRLGAEIDIRKSTVHAKGKLKGNKVLLDFPSVGATENIIMAAVFARGESIIKNAAREPEIVDLCDFLRKAGAKIEGDGTSAIQIQGVKKLRSIEYKPIPDRIEAGTFMIAAAATKSTIKIENIIPRHNQAAIRKLINGGMHMVIGDDYVKVKSGDFRFSNVYTQPYPGFPTDLQAPMMVLCCRGQERSSIAETMFENRYTHVPQLKKLGADITMTGEKAFILPCELKGTRVKATDLRAGAAMVIAGLCAEGVTLVEDPGHIKRGYDSFASKLSGLGADIKVIQMQETCD